MKRSINSLIGYTMGANDGEIGKVKEFYFDDKTWTIRYLIVETGSWLFGRKVLISPQALKIVEWEQEVFPVNLSKEQIKNSPDIDTEMPVSRQQEIKLYEHYPWTSYWGGYLWGAGIGTSGMMMPMTKPFEQAIHDEQNVIDKETNTGEHLRSTHAVTGYNVDATDGEIGEVEDFLIDDETWEIAFIVIDTGHWLSGKKVLISPKWIEEIVWANSKVTVNTSKQHIKTSPAYETGSPIDKAYEASIYTNFKMLES